MKIQIIQLDRYDDYISVRDKMGWNQAQCVLLVWPKKVRVLNQRLELNLVKRYAEKIGARLVFLTDDRVARYQARKQHIPVIDHPRQINSIHWPVESQHNKLIYKHRNARVLESLRRSAHPNLPPGPELPAHDSHKDSRDPIRD